MLFLMIRALSSSVSLHSCFFATVVFSWMSIGYQLKCSHQSLLCVVVHQGLSLLKKNSSLFSLNLIQKMCEAIHSLEFYIILWLIVKSVCSPTIASIVLNIIFIITLAIFLFKTCFISNTSSCAWNAYEDCNIVIKILH